MRLVQTPWLNLTRPKPLRNRPKESSQQPNHEKDRETQVGFVRRLLLSNIPLKSFLLFA